jgi:hypothetical protein
MDGRDLFTVCHTFLGAICLIERNLIAVENSDVTPQNGRSVRHRVLVRKLAMTTSAVVRLWELSEPPGVDRRPALEERPGDAVHAVHDAVAGPEDDRVRRVYLVHSAEVLYDLPDSGPLQLIEPVLGVDLREIIESDLLSR